MYIDRDLTKDQQKKEELRDELKEINKNETKAITRNEMIILLKDLPQR